MNRPKMAVAGVVLAILAAGCTPAAAAEPAPTPSVAFPDDPGARTRPAPDPSNPGMPDDPNQTRTRPAPDPSNPALPGGGLAGGCS